MVTAESSRTAFYSVSTAVALLIGVLVVGCEDGSGMGSDAGRDAGSAADVDSGVSLPEVCGDAPLTDWEQMMLDAHNRWRGMVEPPAADMYRVHWDRAIADNAARWVSSCDPEWPHSPDDSRMGIGGYENLGENLSYCAGTGCNEHSEVADGSGMGDGEGWWEERHDYDHATDTSTGVTSHYTQFVSSNVYAIGCATQRCDAPGPFGWDGEWWWTICQYGPRGQGFWTGTRPYEAGAGGLVEPPLNVYDDHSALCESAPAP